MIVKTRRGLSRRAPNAARDFGQAQSCSGGKAILCTRETGRTEAHPVPELGAWQEQGSTDGVGGGGGMQPKWMRG